MPNLSFDKVFLKFKRPRFIKSLFQNKGFDWTRVHCAIQNAGKSADKSLLLLLI